jgi:Lhr-like helicase
MMMKANWKSKTYPYPISKAKKIDKFRKEKDKQIKTHKRLFSRVLAKEFLKNIKHNTLEIVDRNGFFRNPLDIKIMN